MRIKFEVEVDVNDEHFDYIYRGDVRSKIEIVKDVIVSEIDSSTLKVADIRLMR